MVVVLKLKLFAFSALAFLAAVVPLVHYHT